MNMHVNVRKGSTFVIIIFILAIFIIGFAYSILQEPVNQIYNNEYNKSTLQDEEYQLFFRRAKTIWMWAIPISFIPVLIWMINEGNKVKYGG